MDNTDYVSSSDMPIQGYVVKLNDCYFIMSNAGQKIGPCFRTRAQAEGRLPYGNDTPGNGDNPRGDHSTTIHPGGDGPPPPPPSNPGTPSGTVPGGSAQ